MGNLLMVSNYPSDTGYAWWLMEYFWITLAEKFSREGYQSFLAYPKITTLPENIAKSPIDTIELSIPWTNYKKAIVAIKFIAQNNIKAIYFTDQPYFSIKYLMLRLAGIKKIVIHDHTPGDRPPVTGLKGFIKSLINRMPLITADNVYCVSELMRERDITNGRIPAKKCITIQNGISPLIDQDNRLLLRQNLGLNQSSFVVITTGRAHPYKRFDFVIECARLLKQDFPDLDVKFLLIGDGPVMHDLQKLAKKYLLENTVYLLGFRTDIHDLLHMSDLALHAALGEGFSLSIIEYMSAGLPVLVPDIPSVAQAIENDKNGYIYPYDDPEFAVRKIEYLTKNNAEVKRLGKNAKEKANNKYTLNLCTEDFNNAITQSFI